MSIGMETTQDGRPDLWCSQLVVQFAWLLVISLGHKR